MCSTQLYVAIGFGLYVYSEPLLTMLLCGYAITNMPHSRLCDSMTEADDASLTINIMEKFDCGPNNCRVLCKFKNIMSRQYLAVLF